MSAGKSMKTRDGLRVSRTRRGRDTIRPPEVVLRLGEGRGGGGGGGGGGGEKVGWVGGGGGVYRMGGGGGGWSTGITR